MLIYHFIGVLVIDSISRDWEQKNRPYVSQGERENRP